MTVVNIGFELAKIGWHEKKFPETVIPRIREHSSCDHCAPPPKIKPIDDSLAMSANTDLRPDFDLNSIVRPNILALKPYRCARDDYQSGVLLDANENSYGS